MEKLGNHGDFLGLLAWVLQLIQGSGCGGGALVSNSRRGAGRRASLPDHKPNICCTKVWKSLAHKYVPCGGWSQAELPAAVSFHQRGRARWEGCCREGAGWGAPGRDDKY